MTDNAREDAFGISGGYLSRPEIGRNDRGEAFELAVVDEPEQLGFHKVVAPFGAQIVDDQQVAVTDHVGVGTAFREPVEGGVSHQIKDIGGTEVQGGVTVFPRLVDDAA